MKKCTYCAKEIQDEVIKCKHCGVMLSDDLLTNESNKKVKPKRLGCGCSLLIIIGSVFFIVMFNSNSTSPDTIGAYVFSQQVIKNLLKSPRSAIFATYNESRVSYLTNKKYGVRSYVDSQNSFGALLRTYFTVIVEEKGKNNWEVIDIKLDE